MRTAFVDELVLQAESDDRLMLLTADLGWSVLDRFAERHPKRFLNVGVAEANMVGVATGLAQVGYMPFVYSIATFASMRPYEQIRNGPVLHRLPVRIVGVGGGYAYGHSGATHFALEDLAIARCQPGLTVLAPADPAQTRAAVRATLELPGPVYLRVGKGNNPLVPGLDGRFALGRPEVVREGKGLLILATGSIAVEVVQAADALQADGHAAAVAVMAHLPAEPSSPLCDLLARFDAVITVEEGYVTGGLGALVAEAMAGGAPRGRLLMLGIREPFSGRSGSAEYLKGLAGLDAASLAEAARRFLAGKGAGL